MKYNNFKYSSVLLLPIKGIIAWLFHFIFYVSTTCLFSLLLSFKILLLDSPEFSMEEIIGIFQAGGQEAIQPIYRRLVILPALGGMYSAVQSCGHDSFR